MRFLFATATSATVHLFFEPIRALCAGGHEVLVRTDRPGKHGVLTRRLEAESPGLQFIPNQGARLGTEVTGGTSMRKWIDYLRFCDSGLAAASAYRDRRARALPSEVLSQTNRLAESSPSALRALSAGLRAIERNLPVPDSVMRVLDEDKPDALVVSPLFSSFPQQVLLVRAARRLGIPSALCVASWDNLASKGVIHEIPDRVIVWNDIQRAEAIRHGVPADRVVITGVPRFDPWFEQKPTTTRQEYCEQLGLPVDRPHILYVGSHMFENAPSESEWIVEWVSALRASGHPELRDVPVVVRPHPVVRLDSGTGSDAELENLPGVVIHPKGGNRVLEETAFEAFFDSLCHAGAVVGINTSAMIEAAIVGRPVHVVFVERFQATQEDAPHFVHLRSAGGGLLVETKTITDHARGLARSLRGDDIDEVAARSSSFLGAFVRPHGLDRPASPFVVDALLDVARLSVTPAPPDISDLLHDFRQVVASETSLAGDSGAGASRRPAQVSTVDDWLDAEMPAGSSVSAAELRAAAESAGIPKKALSHALRRAGVAKRDVNGRRVLSRP
jgi:hypothetical protein